MAMQQVNALKCDLCDLLTTDWDTAEQHGEIERAFRFNVGLVYWSSKARKVRVLVRYGTPSKHEIDHTHNFHYTTCTPEFGAHQPKREGTTTSRTLVAALRPVGMGDCNYRLLEERELEEFRMAWDAWEDKPADYPTGEQLFRQVPPSLIA